MRYFLAALGMACFALAGCETVANVAQGVADKAREIGDPADSAPTSTAAKASPCEANFTVSGNFFTGKQFKSHVGFPGVSPDKAYARAYAQVVKEGWQIVQADRSMHVLSVNQQVALSEGGKTTPLNILVQGDSGSGSIVSFTFSISGGLMTSTNSVRDGFCDFAKEIEG